MRLLRSLLFLVWLYGMMALCGIAFLVTFLMPRRAAIWATAQYSKSILFGLRLICGIRTELRGLEHMPQGAAIYAGKHHCMLDVFIPFLITRDPAIILKKELVWTPFLGWYALKCGMIPIDRSGTSRTLKAMLAATAKATSEGRQVVIFPEGTRRPPNAPADYQAAGISALNKALGVPIVPVATNAGLCWPARGLGRRSGLIVYEVLPPIPPGLDRRALMARLEADLETASNRLIEEGRAAQARIDA